MMQKLSIFLSKNRRLLPLSAAIVLFSIAYAVGAVYLPGMRDSQVFLQLIQPDSIPAGRRDRGNPGRYLRRH